MALKKGTPLSNNPLLFNETVVLVPVLATGTLGY